jgi:hypothetical protein
MSRDPSESDGTDRVDIPAYAPREGRKDSPVLRWFLAVLFALGFASLGAFGGCVAGMGFILKGWTRSSGTYDGSTGWMMSIAAGAILGLTLGGFIAGRWIVPRKH